MIATAVLMEAVGLSAALGAFIAGVLLADSEYRHELARDAIEARLQKPDDRPFDAIDAEAAPDDVPEPISGAVVE